MIDKGFTVGKTEGVKIQYHKQVIKLFMKKEQSWTWFKIQTFYLVNIWITFQKKASHCESGLMANYNRFFSNIN